MDKKTRIPALSIIVGVDEEGGFGKDGKIPWYFPEDLKNFKKVTDNSVCIMGRKTYEDMLEMVKKRKKDKKKKLTELLPNRTCFVVTSNENYEVEGATAVRNIRAAVEELDESDSREIFIVGGLRMYIEGLAWTETIYLTIVKGKTYGCDRFFPIDIINKKYKIVNGRETEDLSFLTYKRG